MVHIGLSTADALLLREVLQAKLLALSTEINRTEQLDFKKGLRNIERALDQIVRQLPERAAT